MLIERKLPQFENEKILIVVASEHKVKFYSAANGQIIEMDAFVIDNPQYTDREGFFGKMKGKENIATGSVYEAKKSYLENKFFNKFKKELTNLEKREEYTYICLFCPEFLLSGLLALLPVKIKEKIKITVKGIYVNCHPSKLLEILKKDKSKIGKSVPVKQEARKLFDKNNI